MQLFCSSTPILSSPILEWKYDCVRATILGSLGDEGLALIDIEDPVRDRISKDQLSRLGSVMWHVTSVKLNMEVDREIERVKGQSPQYLIRRRS